ncbi:MAG: hypothetical protein ORN49_12625, partial [Rhodobacteraceae bacterium]|nr:hypothetical protein [Paracoccaceae bacterium]
MTENRPNSGQIAWQWWGAALRPLMDTGAARALRARVRRAVDVVSVLSEPAVVALYDQLGRDTDPHLLAAVA